MGKNRDGYYFESFVNLIDFSLRASVYLDEIVSNYSHDLLEEYKTKMHKIEHGADEARHDVMANLYREFITPIEREDILELLRLLDDVTDGIEDIVLTLYLYDVKELRPEVIRFTSIISKCAISLKLLMQEFVHYKKSKIMKTLIIDVLHFEEECDRLYAESVHRLFIEEKDPIQLHIWDTIFLKLEDCCDYCGEASKGVETALFRNL